MTNETIIEELNTLLRGTYMGIRSFEHYIQKAEENELKKVFQSMQQEVNRILRDLLSAFKILAVSQQTMKVSLVPYIVLCTKPCFRMTQKR
jgi:hypothetical protein